MEKNKKMDDILNSINKIIKPATYHLFVGNEIVSSQKLPKLLRDDVKKNFEPPKKPIKGYMIRIKIDVNDKTPISVNCVQVTINEKLIVKSMDDDGFQTVTYTPEEILKLGFKMAHIKKIIKAIKNHTVSFNKSLISITELLKK